MSRTGRAGSFDVLHRLPGRVRLRAHGLGSRERAADFEAFLHGTSGIDSVTVNLRSGSVLVRHSCSWHDLYAAITAALARGRAQGREQEPVARPRPKGRRKAAAAKHAPAGASADWHELGGDAVAERLQTSATRGITEAEAAERLATHGENRIRERAEPAAVEFLVRQVATAPIALLGGAAFVSAATGGVADAVGIAVAIAINTAIGATTEWQAEKTIRLLAKPLSDSCSVRRGGRDRYLRPAEIVPGDLLILSPGALVAADARLLHTDRLTVDESALTGESMPVDKHEAATFDADTPLADRSNMVYRGTTVTGGNALAVVVATGAATEVGRIHTTAETAAAPETAMQRQLGELGRQLSWLSVAACAAVFAVGALRGGRLSDLIKAAISLGVAAVPEGLPAVATSTLAIGVRNMRRRGLLVRNLHAVETIGAVDVVCLDKTGTLTENRIVPAAAYVAGHDYTFEQNAATGRMSMTRGLRHRDFDRLVEFVAISNDSTLRHDESGPVFEGSATENALLQMALVAEIDVDEVRGRYPRLGTSYRSEDRPWMSTLHRSGSRGRLRVVKGSPREVLALCATEKRRGRRKRLDDAGRERILAENERWSRESLRVLGVAYDQYGEQEGDRPGEYTWMGLVGLKDPLRTGMKEIIADLQNAGTRTLMLTGDQMGTATAIGRQLALAGDEPLKVLDSRDLARLDPELLEAMAQQTHVFARVSPANKLEIVRALQRAGKVVAMTGDGINDGPALKAADVGIAMGAADNDVAHSVADIVLEDDRLETVIAALAQGRAIYANVRKSIHFLVSTNLSEIELMLIATAAGLGMPLTPMQLLWINLATDALPAIALGLDPPDPALLREPPRERGDPVISGARLRRMLRESGVITAASFASLIAGRLRYGDTAPAKTMAFNTIVIAQLLHSLACRSERSLASRSLERNRMLETAVAASVGLQIVALFLPPLRRFLGSGRLGIGDAVISTGAAAASFVANDLLKRSNSGRTRHE
jgi:Ca2+-transporting ATPase